ncbi:MAG: hypothetical protein RL238_3236 [Actinomycetota bacterium]
MIVVQTVAVMLVVAVVLWFLRGVMFFIRTVGYSDLPDEQFSNDRLFTFLSRDVVVDIVAAVWPIAPWVIRRFLAERWEEWKLQPPPIAAETARGALRRLPKPQRSKR